VQNNWAPLQIIEDQKLKIDSRSLKVHPVWQLPVYRRKYIFSHSPTHTYKTQIGKQKKKKKKKRKKKKKERKKEIDLSQRKQKNFF